MNYRQDPSIKFMIVLNKMMSSITHKMAPHFKALGIHETEFFVLFALDANGPMTIQEIGSKIDMTSGTMTYVIDKLEKKDYIKRVRCQEDRRRIYIELTDQGVDFWNEIISKHMIAMNDSFSHMTEDEMLQLIELMKKVGKG
ncbi:MarR family transcriptional regulator [Acidaminobacter sp. JC074]|uniref:MarR family winged helix-turn-helix transcriptional regulator n=1 Tax=Acidaminobacter sp. JC074 TaxID=2530199 RepID=UPI001F0F3AAF|nr:MarR family transcriptional regulator [Acidaminobacter sp. JC074]MCH4887174.1 MarR family transcriptional regulator [Acidaminobacter sp. JC074]